jgi:hypothetical protein
MSQKIILNGSDSVNYLIHGQDLNLSFSFSRTWFVLIKYNAVPNTSKFRKKSFWFWQSLFFFKKEGVFNSKVSVFYPSLKIIVFGLKPQIINLPLKVQQVKLRKQLPIVKFDATIFPIKRQPKINIASCKMITIPKPKDIGGPAKINAASSISLPWNELDKRIYENLIK